MGHKFLNSMPELLAPAGNMERLQTALIYGADAVYVGGKFLNLRGKSSGFDWPELDLASKIVHEQGARIYFCLNSFPRQSDLAMVKDYLQKVANINIDGLIIADPGVIRLARQTVPQIPIHLSTQANTTNSSAVEFWASLGIKRVNLARELNLKQIREIRQQCPDIELECFVHGAQCMAWSGRCLLSDYLNRRGANIGLCTHPCRFEYRPQAILLEEKERPGQPLWEVYEEDNYTVIMASEDLCLVKYLSWFKKRQINALKIEGRMKTISYLAHVTDVYKTALKDLDRGLFRPQLYIRELSYVSSRDIGSGFFLPSGKKLFPRDQGPGRTVWGKIETKEKTDTWLVSVRSRFESGQPCHIMLPGLKRIGLKNNEFTLENSHGMQISTAHPGQKIYLRSTAPEIKTGLLLGKED